MTLFPRRPGAGWVRCAPHVPVFDHASGIRIHTMGIVILPDGRRLSVVCHIKDMGLAQAVRQQGGNRRRGAMVWGLLMARDPSAFTAP